MSRSEYDDDDTPNDKKQWIRGVNVGGWLLLERFITPYMFAVNSCHLEGDLCWYPGQAGAPKINNNDFASMSNVTRKELGFCDPHLCKPIRPLQVYDGNADYHPYDSKPYNDYPIDEYTLGQVFANRTLAQLYMERHWDTFVTYQDLVDLKSAGVTHLRVPMSYWIRGDVRAGEPYIPGGWPYFIRFAKWCREIKLNIWADLHGAPGSENGFDNSGHYLGNPTCKGWSDSPENVQRTVDIVTDIAMGIAEEGLTDVVTGFGLINEPFLDCDMGVLRNYYNQGLAVVRNILGPNTAVFVGDKFQSWSFNDGFWTDEDLHDNTYLDSHPYQVFFEKGRAFTPHQHIAYVCRHNHEDVTSCCYDDPPANTQPSKGISRIVGEWSAAYDSLPTAMAPYIMKKIAATGIAPHLNRTLPRPRMDFMRNYVEAQMVAYEAKSEGVSSGWLFWNFKMEGGAYAEWDFLRGIKEGWMPRIPDPTVASEDLYGSCYDIYNRTSDAYNSIVQEYPDPRTLDWNQWQGWDATDDFVMSDPSIQTNVYHNPKPWYSHWIGFTFVLLAAGLVFFYRRRGKQRDLGYEQLK